MRPEDDVEFDALADEEADPDANYHAEKSLPAGCRPYNDIKISDFQIIRLSLTPSCLFTYYQMAVDRLLKKARGKVKRELETWNLMKRVRSANELARSFETFEVFDGLKRKYKNDYINVVNVSLDTEESIV